MITPQILCDEIKKLELDIFDIQKEIEGLQRGIQKVENQLLDDIENASDVEGKKMFTNDRKRKSELDKRAQTHTTYLDLTLKIDKYREAQKKGLIELDFKKRSFRVHELVSRAGQ